MYVETSAIVAILIGEPDGSELLSRIEDSQTPTTSIVSKVEAALAIGRATGNLERSAEIVEEFLERLEIRVTGVGADLYRPIVQVAVRFGKGSGHPARLNFGDCFSYAIAKQAGLQLLYKGDDFASTDLA